MKIKTGGINLLPKEYIQAQRVKIYIFIAVIVILLESVLFVGTTVIPSFSLKHHEEQVLLELELMKGDARFTEVNTILKQLEDTKSELTAWTNQYKVFKQNNFINTELTDTLIARLPSGITIDKLDFISNDQKISLVGKTKTVEALINYVTILESTFKKAQIEFNVSDDKKNAGEGQGTQINYTLNITMPAVEEANSFTQNQLSESNGGDS